MPENIASTKIKPGEVRNPKGRPSAGLSIREWINVMQGKCEHELRKVARDKSEIWTKRTAAERMLRTLEAPDIADFQQYLEGEIDLVQLRKSGINTECVKKTKVKTRTYGGGNGAEPTTEIEREIELYDRAAEDFDRVVEHTAGKPKQSVDHTSDGEKISFTLRIGERDVVNDN